jgi:hypothetical protein
MGTTEETIQRGIKSRGSAGRCLDDNPPLYLFLFSPAQMLYIRYILHQPIITSDIASYIDLLHPEPSRSESNMFLNFCNPSLACEVISGATEGLPEALATYAPDGAWPEGPAYWAYATQYTLLAAYSLKSALGSDFGIMEHQGIRETAMYPIALTGPTGRLFNFADSASRINRIISARESYYGLARWFQDLGCTYIARHTDLDQNATPFTIIWYQSKGAEQDAASIATDRYFKRINVCTLRSSLTDPNTTFVGFKGGNNAQQHGHLDLGSFVVEADGVRWADDLGRDNYDLPGYFGGERWNYYRLNTFGHNTLVVNGANQNTNATAHITYFKSAADRSFAVADLTPAYAWVGVTSQKRGISLYDGKRKVLVSCQHLNCG